MDSQEETNINKSDRRSALWDVQNAFPNYAILVVSQVGIISFSFFNFWFLTKMLGPEGYGGIVALIAASQIGQVFVGWTNLGLVRIGIEEYVSTGKITGTFWAKNYVSLGNIVFLLVLIPFWLVPLSTWLKISTEVFPYVILHFVLTALGVHIQHALQGAKLLRTQSVNQVIERLMTLVLLVTLYFSGNLTTVLALLSYSLSSLIVSLIGFRKIFPFISGSWMPNYESIKKLVIFSLPLAPLSFLGFFSTNYLDVVFISHFLTTKDVGIYSTAYQFVGLATNFTVLANTLLMPMFITLQSHKKESAIEIYLRQILPLIIILWALYCSLLTLAAKYFLPIIFGDKFQEASNVSYILLIGAVLVSPTLLGYSAIAIAKSMTRQSLFIALASSITNLFFNYILIPKYGLSGVAWATVISSAVFSILSIFAVHKKEKIPVSWTCRIAYATLAGAAITFYIQESLSLIILLLAFLIGYIVLEKKIILYLIESTILKPLSQFRK